jgi:hypothetical protein
MLKLKRVGGMLLSLLVIGALGAVSASSAMAAPHWSPNNQGMRLAGSLTFEAKGQPTKTCTVAGPQYSLMTAPETIAVWSDPSRNFNYSCSGGGTISMQTWVKPLSTTSVQVGAYASTQVSPWSGYPNYNQDSFPVADFKNGSGSTQSTITYGGGDIVGHLGSGTFIVPIYVSGTLTVTTNYNTLLTILP